MDRVIALVDMDCFYVQVEQRETPSMKGKPCAVVQYNRYKSGGIIAVGYEARANGVTRGMWGDDARKKCPDIHLFRVQETRGKANLTKYREAGAEVIASLSKFSRCVERASIDEAYIDLTEEVNNQMKTLQNIEPSQLANTFIVGHDNVEENSTMEESRECGLQSWLKTIYDNEDFSLSDRQLAVGALIAEKMRAAVYEETGFCCSAGIAHNKVLAKLSCGIHKPNRQTVLPQESVGKLFQTLPVKKIRSLGGKRGQMLLDQLNVKFMAELVQFTRRELQDLLGDKSGNWLYDMCRGIDNEEVKPRQIAKSIGCGKQFPGKLCLDTKDKVLHWLSELSEELVERLEKDKEKNNRVAKSLVVNLQYHGNPSPVSSSRTCAIIKYDAKKIRDDCYSLLLKYNSLPAHQAVWSPAIILLGMYASKFKEELGGPDLLKFFNHPGIRPNETIPGKAIPAQTASVASPLPSNDKDSNKRSIDTFFSSFNKSSPSNVPENRNGMRDVPEYSRESLSKMKNTPLGNIKGFFASKLMSNESLCIGSAETAMHSSESNATDVHVSADITVKRTQCGKENVCDEALSPASVDSELFKLTPGSHENSSGKFCSNSQHQPRKSINAPKKASKPVIEMMHYEKSSTKSMKNFISSDSAPKDRNTASSKTPESDLEETIHKDIAVEVLETLSGDIQEEIHVNTKRDIYTHTSTNQTTLSMHTAEKMAKEMNKRFPNSVEIMENSLDQSPVVSTFRKMEQTSDTNSTDDLTKCDKCGDLISAWVMPEHMDFHYAEELQNSLNAPTLPLGGSVNTSIRKRKVDKNYSAKQTKKARKSEGMKSLAFFFEKNS